MIPIEVKTEEIYNLFLKSGKVSTDSRNIEKGTIYFALKGESFDGNQFAKSAIDSGASYAIIDNPKYYIDNSTILVDNVLLELQKLANYHRKKINLPVIAITGTNGKTTTKELLKEVLAQKYNVLSTVGNLNNHIGVPLTLLNITKEHQFAIIEMGANHPKEIEFLCDIAEPNFGIITNIGKAHLEGFGGFQGVISTKNELYVHLIKHKGKIFYNSKNPILSELLLNKNVETIRYCDSKDLVYGEIISANPYLKLKVTNAQNLFKSFKIQTNIIGTYNLENILAAVCVGVYFNISELDISNAIQRYKPINNRSQLTQTEKNTLFIDCYNANPTSTEAALVNLIQTEATDKFAILGDMLELGNESIIEHEKIIQTLLNNSLKCILVGKIYSGLAKKYGLLCFVEVEEAIEYIKLNPITNKLVLLKGSRGIKLEKLISQL